LVYFPPSFLFFFIFIFFSNPSTLISPNARRFLQDFLQTSEFDRLIANISESLKYVREVQKHETNGSDVEELLDAYTIQEIKKRLSVEQLKHGRAIRHVVDVSFFLFAF
jgi:hypothetical protein